MDPIEVDFVVGAIVAELAADEYYIQLECNDRTELQRSTTTHNTNSELFSYLLS